MQAVQCMADELRATGRVYDIQFSRGFRYQRTTAKLGYGFNDLAGGQHFRWIDLTNPDAGWGYGYETAVAHPNDPEQDMQQVWSMKCGVAALLVIY